MPEPAGEVLKEPLIHIVANQVVRYLMGHGGSALYLQLLREIDPNPGVDQIQALDSAITSLTSQGVVEEVGPRINLKQ